jgi:hypothetical protein
MDKMDTHKKKVLEALEKSLGVVTTACKAAGCPRSTFYLWCKEDTHFKELVDDISEQSIDFAESQLFTLIKGVVLPDDKPFVIDGNIVVHSGQKHYAPDTAATIFYLKTKGKKRGYVERQELTGKDGEKLTLSESEVDKRINELLGKGSGA